MKALVLAAGKGRRLRNSIGEISKCMIDLDGRPLLSYALDNAVKAKITEAVIVVGYKAETIMEYFGDEYQGMPLTYAFQKEQNGIIDAMESGIEALNGEDFLLLAGDELLFNPRHQEMIAEHYAKKSFITCGMVDKDNIETIKKTYTIQYNDDKIITKLVEKPQTVFNHLKGSCSCVFSGHIFDYKKDIGGGVSANTVTGQKEFGGLLHYWMRQTVPVRYFVVADRFVNVNFAEDLELALNVMKYKK